MCSSDLLPLAYEGLDRWGVDPAERDRLLGIVERRCVAEINGAAWQVATVRHLERQGYDRVGALHELLRRYSDHMHSNEPVHTWPTPPL